MKIIYANFFLAFNFVMPEGRQNLGHGMVLRFADSRRAKPLLCSTFTVGAPAAQEPRRRNGTELIREDRIATTIVFHSVLDQTPVET